MGTNPQHPETSAVGQQCTQVINTFLEDRKQIGAVTVETKQKQPGGRSNRDCALKAVCGMVELGAPGGASTQCEQTWIHMTQ